MYDYREAVKEDVREAVKNDYDFTDFDSLEDLEEQLNNDLWIDDAVTGNGSGSYTFNTWQAEEYLCHNTDLLQEALNEFGEADIDVLEEGAEFCDVTIRCYLLGEAIAEVMEEIEDDFEKAHEEIKNAVVKMMQCALLFHNVQASVEDCIERIKFWDISDMKEYLAGHLTITGEKRI